MEGIYRTITQAGTRAAKEGKGSCVLLSALSNKLGATMQVIRLDGFDRVQEKMAKLARNKPEWFAGGFNGIYPVSNPELFAAFDPEKNISYFSVASELVSGYSPAHELIDAFTSGKPMTFNNEYAIETLWHELMHGMTGIKATKHPYNAEPLAEGVVQLAARHSYHMLAAELGLEAIHQDKVITHGLAYPMITANLLALMKISELGGERLLSIIMENNDWEAALKAEISANLNISTAKVKYLLNQAEIKNIADFNAKIAVQVKNAQRNKGAS